MAVLAEEGEGVAAADHEISSVVAQNIDHPHQRPRLVVG